MSSSSAIVHRNGVDKSLLNNLAAECINEFLPLEGCQLSSSGNVVDVGPGFSYSCVLPKASFSQAAYTLAFSRGVQEILRNHADSDVVTWPHVICRAFVGEQGAPTVHQDFPELQGGKGQINCWIPMSDVSTDSGGLPVYEWARGREDAAPLVLTSASLSGWMVDPDFLDAKTTPDLAVGDCLCFSAFTPHGGSTNSSGRLRFSVEVRAQYPGGSLCEPLLSRPSVGGQWTDLETGTLSMLNLDSFSMIPFDDSWERWRDIAALSGRFSAEDSRRALEIAAEWGKSTVIRAAASRQLSTYA